MENDLALFVSKQKVTDEKLILEEKYYKEQKANIENVMELFNTAKTKFESLKVTNYKKLNEAAIKNSIPFKLKSIDEFLAE